MAEVDALVGRLLAGVDALSENDPIYVVIVSDHGMLNYLDEPPRFVIDDAIDMKGVRAGVGGPVMFLYLDEPARAPAIRDALNAVPDATLTAAINAAIFCFGGIIFLWSKRP